MAVPVQSDLVALVPDARALLREGLEAVAGDEPGGFYVVFVEELEEALDAERAGVVAAADVAG